MKTPANHPWKSKPEHRKVKAECAVCDKEKIEVARRKAMSRVAYEIAEGKREAELEKLRAIAEAAKWLIGARERDADKYEIASHMTTLSQALDA